MKAVALTIPARSRKLIWLSALGALLVLVIFFVSFLPPLARELSRLADWFTGLLSRPIRFWEGPPWLY